MTYFFADRERLIRHQALMDEVRRNIRRLKSAILEARALVPPEQAPSLSRLYNKLVQLEQGYDKSHDGLLTFMEEYHAYLVSTGEILEQLRHDVEQVAR